VRIGLDLTHCYQRKGGIQSYAIQLTRALCEIDRENHYILFFRAEKQEELAHLNAEIHVSPIKNQVLCEQTWLFCAAIQARLDVFHFTGFAGPLIYMSKSVSTVCDMNQFFYPETMKRSQYFYWRWLFPIALRRRTAIITISEHSRDDINRVLNINKNNIRTIPLAAKPIFVEPRTNRQLMQVAYKYKLPAHFFLVVGTLEPRKNHLSLFEAYAFLRNQGKCLPPIVCVGRKGWLYNSVLSRLTELQLKDHILFIGMVSDEDLSIIYRLALALLYPSVYEGFGLPILEAMASGCPVLTSNVSSMPEVAGDAAHYVDPFNIHSIADGLQAILDASYRAKLVNRGQSRLYNFSWQRTAKETIAVYYECYRNLNKCKG
jgi:glycosyltransferase involved in cell wall biosynthesis